MKQIRVKRIYEPPEADDGVRILVDRVWPRGLRKADAGLDHWLPEVAPSTELRRWFGHRPERWPEFRERYRSELAAVPATLCTLLDRSRANTLTLLYAARDRERNQALVLQEVLQEELAEEGRREPSSAVCYGAEFSHDNGLPKR